MGAKVTKTSAEQYLESHPDEGSMLAYSDTLSHFKIENAALRITENDILTLPTPFITFSHRDGGTFTIIKSIKDNTVEWLDTQSGWMQSKWIDFAKDWSGVVLLAETDEYSGEKAYQTKKQEEVLRSIRIPLAITLLSVFLLYCVISLPLQAFTTYMLIGLKLGGVVITSLLFIKSIDNANSLVNKLCNAGSKISCQSILDSPAAKITPWFSWSDAGFIYFFGSFFGLLWSLPNDLEAYLSIQLIFSVSALVFSSYSLYYQGIKAKMWCTLCLGVVAVLILEAVLTFTMFSAFEINALVFTSITASFLIPIVFLLIFKNTAVKAQESKNLKRELTKLKANPKIFEAIMAGQPEMPEIPADMPVVSIGNPNAEHTITMVSNPLCTPCAHMHARIESLLAENENIKCDIIFLSSTHQDDPGGKFVRKLFSLPNLHQHKALHEWFSRNDKNFEKWNESLDIFITININTDIQAKNNDWVESAQIKATPALFYNGTLLTFNQNISDLIYIINNIKNDN